MKRISLPPDAAVLLESMRAIGYDAPAAIADLIDNSVTAQAHRVSIRFNPGSPGAVGVLDDGCGMDEAELRSAMRHGSRSPLEVRAPGDLGRFGLGLKTASMSQCRRLTVLSRRSGRTHGMVWDLDDVALSRDWIAGALEPAEIRGVPFAGELESMDHGTLVVWEKLDVLAAGDPGDGSLMSGRMQQVAEHLALVFHRYLSSHFNRLALDINLQPVEPLDPFLEEEGSLAGEEERIFVDGHPVVLRAFTLPHISRLTRQQIDRAGGEVGLRRNQGFYVYRNRRLVVTGTWFRMFRQEELTKLARVRVDVPNALDHLWSLDIKKSTASPPAAIRERLKRLVPAMVRQSLRSHQYRGRTANRDGFRPIWSRIEDRGGVRYEIDLTHPVIEALRTTADDGMVPEIDNVLHAVSDSLPIEPIYNDRANDVIGHKQEHADESSIVAELEELARQMLGAFADRREERERLLSSLERLEPFALHPELIPPLRARLSE